MTKDGEVLPLTETKLQKKLGKGFDLKTDTGYTILPPSPHPDTKTPYEWRGDYQNPLEHPVHWMPEKLAGGAAYCRPTHLHSRVWTAQPPGTGGHPPEGRGREKQPQLHHLLGIQPARGKQLPPNPPIRQ